MTPSRLAPGPGGQPIPLSVRAAAILFAWVPPVAFLALFLPHIVPALVRIGKQSPLPRLTLEIMPLAKVDPWTIGLIGAAVAVGLVSVDFVLAVRKVPYNRLWLAAAVLGGWIAFLVSLIATLLPAGQAGGFDV